MSCEIFRSCGILSIPGKKSRSRRLSINFHIGAGRDFLSILCRIRVLCIMSDICISLRGRRRVSGDVPAKFLVAKCFQTETELAHLSLSLSHSIDRRDRSFERKREEGKKKGNKKPTSADVAINHARLCSLDVARRIIYTVMISCTRWRIDKRNNSPPSLASFGLISVEILDSRK